MTNIYDPIAFTQRAVYGIDTNTGLSTTNDYNDHIRPLTGSPAPQAFEFDMLDYLENGAGRYAVPAIFPLIDKFFQSSTITPGTYVINPQIGGTEKSIYDELNIPEDDLNTPNINEREAFTEAAIWQYGTDVTSPDFAERAYLFGTTPFKLDITNAVFTVNLDGRRSVSGMRVIALDDNFDFKGGSPINKFANFFLLPAYDPYGLIREAVPIKYTTSTQGREYFYNDDLYTTDNIKEALFVSVKGTTAGFAKLVFGLDVLDANIKNSGTRASNYLKNIDSDSFFRYERGNSKVIYGTPNADDIGVFKDIDIEFYNDNPIRTASSFDVPNSPNLTNLLMVGGGGNDTITSGAVGDELLGGDGNDVLKGGGGNDTLNGSKGNESIDGGGGEDVAVFTDTYANENGDPNYVFLNEDTTVSHLVGQDIGIDGIDILQNIEWGQFKGEPPKTTPRMIPLPLEDGIIETETVRAIDNTASPNTNDLPTPPYISLSMPVAMLDGNVDYTLNISPYKPNIEYNIAYLFDTSASMDAGELQAAKNAYTDLTNYFINNGLAENINFGVVKFSRYATLYQNLTAQQAISTIQGLTSSPAIEGTKYNDALYQGMNFITQSPLKGTTNIAYFVSDGRSQTNFADPSDVSYVYDAMNLRRVSNVQSFGIYDPLDPGGVIESQINFVDSNNGVLVNSASGLSTELIKSGLADKVAQVNILVDGEVVDTIQPSQLTDSPLGLTYEGSVDNLDVSANAENVITAEVVFNDNTITTSAEFTVTAGDGKLLDANGNPIVEVAEISIKRNSVFSILSTLIKHLLLKKYTFYYHKICIHA